MSGPSRPLIIAHRAGNNIAAARTALDAGADIIEADVWWHAGRLEVRHAKSLRPLPLLWDRWKLALAFRPALRFQELLAALPADAGLMIDLKGRARELPGRLIGALGRGMLGRQVIVCGQNWPLLAPFAVRDEVLVARSIGREEQIPLVWPLLERVEHGAVSIHYRLLSDQRIEELRRVASFIVTWPINSVTELERALAWGVDAITTDSPEMIRTVAALGDPAGQSTAR